uniref:LRRCT domain-containing protein n=1 Tax=Panagrellus redivivus TaxID=6233 RepID=A0A7E4WB33_PANRE
MWWFLFLCLITLASASPSQCPPNLPDTCSCVCNYQCDEPVYLNIHCSTVPDLYELLSTFGNVRFFEIKIDKCEKPVQSLTKLPPFYTICLLINQCGLESVADNAFADISGLELLDLSNNALTEMPVFPHFPLLTYIAINHNLLRDFGESSESKNYSSFDGVPELTQLYFQNNSLTEITDATFANLKQLRTIDLSNNKLQRISANAFRDQPPILDLFLSFNELTYLEPETFRNTDILTVYLDNNRLTHLSANSFNGNKRLDVLHLQHNQLTDIAVGTFNDLEDVWEIRLNNNNLTSIDGISGNLPKLRKVDLSHNRITKVTNTTFNNFWELRLDLSNNQIESVAPNAVNGVYELILNNNKLTTLDGVFDPLEATTVATKDNETCHCTCSNNA